MFGTSDERFSAGDEHVESVRSNFSHTQTATLATSDFQAKLIMRSQVLTFNNGREPHVSRSRTHL